ncbi:MAG: hypothetical protein RH946_02425 [Rhodospirillales bacterium]
MRLKYALIAVSIFMLPGSAAASVDPDFERHTRVTTCKLSTAEMTVLNARWNKLAMRHFTASMDSRNLSGEAEQIRHEIRDGLASLRREFGPECVLDIY